MPRGWAGRSGLLRQDQVIVENNRFGTHDSASKICCRRIESKFPERAIAFPEEHVIKKETGFAGLGNVHHQVAPRFQAVRDHDINRAAKGLDPLDIERVAKTDHAITLVGLNRGFGGPPRRFDIKRRELDERFLGNHVRGFQWFVRSKNGTCPDNPTVSTGSVLINIPW